MWSRGREAGACGLVRCSWVVVGRSGWLGDARHVGRWQHWFAGLRLRETSVIAVLCCAAAHWKELRCLLDETRGHQGDVETMGLESKLCPFTPTQNLLLSLHPRPDEDKEHQPICVCNLHSLGSKSVHLCYHATPMISPLVPMRPSPLRSRYSPSRMHNDHALQRRQALPEQRRAPCRWITLAGPGH